MKEIEQNHTPEPFGYFKAEPFGWSDCTETDEGAQPLYDQAAIDELGERLMVSDYALKDALRQRDVLLAALEKSRAVFDLYVKLHRDKTPPDEEKAARNALHRGVCDEAIASVKGEKA